jgi:plasmid stabilization system protein ParE
MKVKYSPESIKDLKRVIEFIGSKNLYTARRVAIDLQEGVDRLKQFPEIGLPVSSAKDPKVIRDIYIGNYTARYLITENILYVLRVWHNKENEKNKILD